MSFQTACIFVDGENLRHSICDLFAGEFNPAEYLPKTAEWKGFFDFLVQAAAAKVRLRTYWYTVEEIDFWPYNLQKLIKVQDIATLEKIVRQNKTYGQELSQIADATARATRVMEIAKKLLDLERAMRTRFEGWKTVQNGIATKVDSVEFRRAGVIRYDLFSQELGKEKGVDVKLATDLLKLKDIYEVGIILSGDGDYVPAVQAVKDLGNHIVNVSFLRKGGGVLPGGARRLNQAADRTLEIDYDTTSKYILPTVASAKSAI